MKGPRPGAYARAVEQALARARGRPGVLSPRDWARVADWCGRGVPLTLVLEALEEASARARRSGSEVRSLAFLTAAVEEAWRTVESGRVVPSSPATDPGGRGWPWGPAREGLPHDGALARWLDEAQARLVSGVDAATLDSELEELLPDLAGAEALARATAEVDRALAPFRARMTEAEFDTTRCRAVTDTLRRALRLPPLRAW